MINVNAIVLRFAVRLAIAAAAGLGSAALALPPATGFVDCVNPDGSHVEGDFSCGAAFDSASRSLSPFAGLTATANYPGGVAANAAASGYLTYYFSVVGPDTGTAIPIDIDTHLHASTINDGYAFSEILVTAGTDIYHSPSSAYKVICTDPFCTDRSTDFTGTLHVMTEVGLASSVFMEVSSETHPSAPAVSSIASADPLIYLDPSFADAARYSIVLSDGVVNGLPGAVPEPETWVMIAGGFATLGTIMRRRRRTMMLASC